MTIWIRKLRRFADFERPTSYLTIRKDGRPRWPIDGGCSI
jgi:hypothetical protein